MATLHLRGSMVPTSDVTASGVLATTLCGRRDVASADTYPHGREAEKEARRRADGTVVCPACLDVEDSRQTLRRRSTT
jgi:hypothetical protein